MATVRAVTPAEAAQALAGLSALDPRGLCREADLLPMCQAAAHCLSVEDKTGRALIVVNVVNGVHWIEAAGGGGGDNLCPFIDAAMDNLGAVSVGFQTMRPGLVKRAHQLGYRTAGFILRRDK